MKKQNEMLDLNREIVIASYQNATRINREKFLNGDVKSNSEYIYQNQKEDAAVITDKFYKSSIRVCSIVKRTKVGMNGLMIEIAKNMTTHPDDEFVIHRGNLFFATGMSNVAWQDDMKEEIPYCFRDNVYHHGKLHKLSKKLKNIKNSVIIIDEIDTGDKEEQKLHLTLKQSGILDIKYMEDNNIRIVFVSATIINELHELFKWGDKHYNHYMTIPDSYIGHKEFLEKGIIQEFYSIKDDESAERWVREDIIENYGNDFRVHIIRTDNKHKDYILNACNKNNVIFINHTSTDRISNQELINIFNNVKMHYVIAVKGFYRRANLIPNQWKRKIGATHEKYVIKYDTNVQVQGLPGRMSGYWREDIENGLKTGPHRTSINAIKEYEEFYINPLGKHKYNTDSKNTFVNPKNIKNLKIMKQQETEIKVDESKYRIYNSEDILRKVCKLLGYHLKISSKDERGFIKTGGTKKSHVASLKEAINLVPIAIGKDKGKTTYRTCFPCYTDITQNTTLCFVVIIRSQTDIRKIEEADELYPSISI